MHIHLLAAILMIALTTAIHAAGMVVSIKYVVNGRGLIDRLLKGSVHFKVISIVVLMFFVTFLEILAWALMYVSVGAIDGFEKALYFSTVTFTTLGYGDVLLSEKWRLLGSFEAANGIILFGWSTAVVMAAVQKVYMKEDLFRKKD